MIKLSPFQWSSFNFFGFYCAYGVLLPFLPVWLNHHGYNSGLIGLLIASGYLFRFLGAMFFSKRVQHPNQLLSLARWLTWAAIATLFLVAFGVQSIWILFPAIALFHIFNGGAMPIADTIASTWQQQAGIDYGKTRLFGSIAFVVGSVSTGYLVGWLGESAIIGIIIGWLVFLGTGLVAKPTHYFEQSANKSQSDLSYIDLLKVPTTFKMLLAVSLIQASHAAYYAYSTIYWASTGISTQQASLLWGLAVVSEILFFFFANRLFKTWTIYHLMLLSAIGSAVRWGLLASNTNLAMLMALQMFHSISYGAGHYAMIRYISTQPVEQIAKLQALYFGFASCMFMALFTFIAGLVYEVSPTGSFWLMVLFVLPAIFIVPKRVGVRL
ncbi:MULTISPECIES: 3-phenylpropionate MFS transporter [Glaesserella]|uniref:3-phenylpropionate MFS transporter n=1 Tax=Glaesserella australis TaxID=2094024 RepID=A0A328BXT2_9PAST|nr:MULTISPECIES: 3-phenylpropionate MFS transporter [Glaesserella]AUI66023.1 3-phenylpropionate MFS transporter [Glaesserella sp. 15-184]RAL18257.1 3-phenylpropionate MFS transporter [Glaesserella australis]